MKIWCSQKTYDKIIINNNNNNNNTNNNNGLLAFHLVALLG